MNTDIFVATHKPAKFLLSEEYKWIQVNALATGAWEGYLHDSDGVGQISSDNSSFCELTALHRLWKMSNASYKGLVHYRRFLGNRLRYSNSELSGIKYKKEELVNKVLKSNLIGKVLKDYDIILPRPLYPYPLTALEDLRRFVYERDIEELTNVVHETYPDYFECFKSVLKETNLSYCNIFVAPREISDSYCEWLFGLLKVLKERIDISGYDAQHKRVFGYLGEVLLNVYVRKNQLRPCYLNMIDLDENAEPLSFKRKLMLKRFAILARLGHYPNYFDPALGRARNKHYHRLIQKK